MHVPKIMSINAWVTYKLGRFEMVVSRYGAISALHTMEEANCFTSRPNGKNGRGQVMRLDCIEVCIHETNLICVPLDGASRECIACSASIISCSELNCVWSVLMYT